MAAANPGRSNVPLSTNDNVQPHGPQRRRDIISQWQNPHCLAQWTLQRAMQPLMYRTKSISSVDV